MQTRNPSTTPAAEGQDPYEWVAQRLGHLPERTSRLAAVRQLVGDLEVARRAGAMDEGADCEAALLAAFRACHALGRGELAVPFRVLGNGLRDLRRGVQPGILKPARASLDEEAGPGRGAPGPTEHWNLAVQASVALGLLVELAGMRVEEAARAVAQRLAAKNLSLGRCRTT